MIRDELADSSFAMILRFKSCVVQELETFFVLYSCPVLAWTSLRETFDVTGGRVRFVR